MTAQPGRDILLKLQSLSTSSFITVAGLRTRSLTLNAEAVDITHAESAGRWRELLVDAGTRQMSITGDGVFRDQEADNEIRLIFFGGELRTWQIILPDFGQLEGPFHLTSLIYQGTYNTEMTYELSLQSAGEIAFTADSAA